MATREELYQQAYSKGAALAELTMQARILLAMHEDYEKSGDEKIKAYLDKFPRQSQEFLKEALETAKKYSNYDLDRKSRKAIFEATHLPYNFKKYEEWKKQLREARDIHGQEENTESGL